MTGNPYTDRDTINEAFATLREQGIEARGPWTCCMSCGRAELEDRLGVDAAYVFFHIQADDSAFDNDAVLEGYFTDDDFNAVGDYIGTDEKMENAPEGQNLIDTLHLAHDCNPDTYHALQEAFEGTNLEVWWNYDPGRTMTISPRKSDEEVFQEAIQRGHTLFGEQP